MNFAKISAALLIATFGAASFSEPLTLRDAIQTLESNSPQIQHASSARNESYWRKVESYSAFLPSISGSINYLTDYKYMFTDLAFNGQPVSMPNIVPTTIYTVTANYGLFDGLASTNRVRSASLFEKAAIEELDWTKFRMEREVTMQFYRALAAKTLKHVAEANLQTLQDHLHEVNLFKSNGLSTKYDVLRVEVQVSEANSEVMNSADDVENANGRLAELLGQSSTLEPQGNLPALPDNLADSRINGARRADLMAKQDQAEAFSYQKRAASVHWLPKIGLFGQYNYYNNLNDRFDDFDRFRNAYQVGVNLTWNLFDGFSGVAKNREAYEKQYQTEKELKIAQLKAEQDAAMWRRKYKYYYSVYKARQSDIGKAQESVRLAKVGRRVGSRTNTDLLDAETDLFRSQAGAIKAQLGIIEALINLELSTGLKLYEFN